MAETPTPLPAERERSARWLRIVGIGEDGADGLSPRARTAIGQAELVFGGARHLALAGGLIAGEARTWSSPLDASLSEIAAARGRRVCVIASGDPFLYGIGNVIVRHVDPAEIDAIPAPSSPSLAAARLGWPLAETAIVTVHGRPLAALGRAIRPGARMLVMTADGADPARIAALLNEKGFGQSRLTVLEALGGPHERIRPTSADGFDLSDINPLNIVAIECVAAADARIVSLTAGHADTLFEHDGQITKREVRAITLSALAPLPGETLWDVGAGSGSISIEWMLADPSLRACAIERHPDRAARIARNADAFGVPGLDIVTSAAPAAFAGLPTPDAIFIGGGGAGDGVIAACIAVLAPGGRIVANAVTLETEALLLARHAELGGSLTRIAIDRAEPIAGMTGWRPAMPVTMWRWTKP